MYIAKNKGLYHGMEDDANWCVCVYDIFWVQLKVPANFRQSHFEFNKLCSFFLPNAHFPLIQRRCKYFSVQHRWYICCWILPKIVLQNSEYYSFNTHSSGKLSLEHSQYNWNTTPRPSQFNYSLKNRHKVPPPSTRSVWKFLLWFTFLCNSSQKP